MNIAELPLHHAILATTGDRTALSRQLWNELEQLSLAHRFFDQTVLDIETARTIITWAKAPYDKERIALISFHTSGIPAQNALLKILEEPPALTRFILVTSNKSALLPTVLSRLHIIEHTPSAVSHEMVEEFLRTSPGGRMRLKHIELLLEKKDEEDRKDREAVREYILALAEELSQKGASPRYITETLEMASYASDPSASGKSLLEYLSLLLPQMK